MKKITLLGLFVAVAFVLISCASKPQSTQTATVENQVAVPDRAEIGVQDIGFHEETAQEAIWSLEELEGTTWEFETEMFDFQVWRGFEIKDGMAFFYQKMGNAKDMHEGEAISLEGNRIIFTRPDGDTNSGILEEKLAQVNGEIYYLVE